MASRSTRVLQVCRRCLTPAGQPAVRPDVPVYDLVAIGRLAIVAVIVATVSFVALGVAAVAAPVVEVHAARVGDATLLPVADLVVRVLLGLSVTAVVAAVAPVATWLWRARKNLDAFPGAEPTMRARWAVAGWFIPGVNLVLPARAMANVVRQSLWFGRSSPTPVRSWVSRRGDAVTRWSTAGPARSCCRA